MLDASLAVLVDGRLSIDDIKGESARNFPLIDGIQVPIGSYQWKEAEEDPKEDRYTVAGLIGSPVRVIVEVELDPDSPNKERICIANIDREHEETKRKSAHAVRLGTFNPDFVQKSTVIAYLSSFHAESCDSFHAL